MNQTSDQQTGSKAAKPDQIAAWNRLLFEAFVQTAKVCGNAGRFEEVLQWAAVASWFASRKGWFGALSSWELEAELLRAARSLATPLRSRIASSRPRWLHVFTEAYGTLGHTNLCRRWIQYDEKTTHDVILIDQRGGSAENISAAAVKTGGECIVLDVMKPLLERATELRAYAWKNSDAVILHIHPEDVIAMTAFGIAGGPPVLLVNHADHAFWLGCSVADLVLDIRTSGQLWTKQARGVNRTAILPLPLVKKHDEIPCDLHQKRAFRKELGIPEDATLLLTVGSGHKYKPMRGLDFVETALAILRDVPNAFLIAVGPRDEGVWRAARQKTGGRLLALGPQPDSTVFCNAADLYLEGFPAGSLTALLEAGEAGLACVRAPRACIPPVSSDSFGIDGLDQPEDINAYIQVAVGLARDEKARTELGWKLQQAIHSQHCGPGWLSHLDAIKKLIPKSHSIYKEFRPAPVDNHRRDWSIESIHAIGPVPTRGTVAAEVYIESWRRTVVKPQIEPELWAQLKACQTPRGQGSGYMAGCLEKISLWRLNRKIRRQGTRIRLITNARLALASGQRSLARELVYSCLLQCWSSAFDVAWIKVFIKSHLSKYWLVRIKGSDPLNLRQKCAGNSSKLPGYSAKS